MFKTQNFDSILDKCIYMFMQKCNRFAAKKSHMKRNTIIREHTIVYSIDITYLYEQIV